MFHKSHYTFARKDGRMEEWKDVGLPSIHPSNLPFFQKVYNPLPPSPSPLIKGDKGGCPKGGRGVVIRGTNFLGNLKHARRN
jgi:hypothetical protein